MASTVKRSCRGCGLSHLVRAEQDTQRFCHARPPTVAFVPVLRGEAVRYEPQTTFPAVQDEQWCGEFVAKK